MRLHSSQGIRVRATDGIWTLGDRLASRATRLPVVHRLQSRNPRDDLTPVGWWWEPRTDAEDRRSKEIPRSRGFENLSCFSGTRYPNGESHGEYGAACRALDDRVCPEHATGETTPVA